MLKKTSIFLLLLLLITGLLNCSYSEPEKAVEFPDKNFQSQLIDELKKQGIYFRVDKEDRIWFKTSDEIKIDEIVRYKILLSKPSFLAFTYEEEKYMLLLKQELQDHGVEYNEELIKGEKMIKLNYRDELKWKPIKKSIDDLITKNNIKKIADFPEVFDSIKPKRRERQEGDNIIDF